jgi:threonyl-tRNA synthetase
LVIVSYTIYSFHPNFPKKARHVPRFFVAPIFIRKKFPMIQITLPDGSQARVPGPVTVAEVAASIGAGLAKAALAGKVDGKVVDTSDTDRQRRASSIITAKDADGLDVIRHSTAHLLAYAVKELFPDAQVTIGPVIENGFFLRLLLQAPVHAEDLVRSKSA